MRIGLIAMSGVRACDPELLELGLTLPGFVERSKAVAALPSLGLLTLAGLTPSQHELTYVEVQDPGDVVPTNFDLVAISTFSAQIFEAYAVAKKLLDAGVKVVIGGLHVTSLPHEPAVHAPGISAVVGEGELAWPQILADAQRGQLAAVYDMRGKSFDLADAPMPRYELLDMDRYNRITVQSSRGCPWKCSFCASSILLTSRYKQKPAEKVLAEIDAIALRWPRPFIEFADDNGFVNRTYWRKLLPELAKRRIRWFTETDVSVYEDRHLLDALREAGCVEVLIGFESPTPMGLDGLELRRDWKHEKFAVYREAIQTIQAHGIRVNACLVVGLDGHTTQVFDDVHEFVEATCPFDVQITYPTPFPGTPFYHQLKQQGRLTHDGQWDRLTLFDINFKPLLMSAEELREGFFGLSERLYSDAFTQYRRTSFKQQAYDGRRRRRGSVQAQTRSAPCPTAERRLGPLESV